MRETISSCQCASGLYWNSNEGMCYRNCSVVSNSVGNNPYDPSVCDCRKRYRLSGNTCNLDCSDVHDSTGKMKNGGCECYGGYKWRPNEAICQKDDRGLRLGLGLGLGLGLPLLCCLSSLCLCYFMKCCFFEGEKKAAAAIWQAPPSQRDIFLPGIVTNQTIAQPNNQLTTVQRTTSISTPALPSATSIAGAPIPTVPISRGAVNSLVSPLPQAPPSPTGQRFALNPPVISRTSTVAQPLPPIPGQRTSAFNISSNNETIFAGTDIPSYGRPN